MPVLAVDDLDRAVAFYRDSPGLDVQATGDPGFTYLSGGSGTGIILYESTFKRGETPVASFLVEDIQRAVDERRGRGVVFEEYDFPGLKTENGIATSGNMKSAWFKDSEGNNIAVSEAKDELARRVG